MDLSEFTQFYSKFFNDETFIIWDVDLRCVYASPSYLAAISRKNIVGKMLHEFRDEFVDLEQEFRSKVTSKVLKNKEAWCCYLYSKLAGASSFILSFAHVHPITNKAGQVVGLISKLFRVKNDIFIGQLPISQSLGVSSLGYREQLTDRQRLIVFLLIFGKSHKEISLSLSSIYGEEVSLSSVRTMISRQIYKKFNVNSSSELIYLAIVNGYLYNIPPEIAHLNSAILYAANLRDFTRFQLKGEE